VHSAERAARAATGRDDLRAARYAAEFLGPVPVADVVVTTEVLRVARSAVLVAATLTAAERVCLAARVWLVADTDTTAIAHADDPSGTDPTTLPEMADADFGYGLTIEWRSVSGGLSEPGPGRIWTRPRIPVLPDEPMSSLQRAVLVGDSASGVSSELDWAQWSFVNLDLDVHLARPVEGEWLLLDAATQLGPRGVALARSTISDRRGPAGGTAQTLLLAPRRR
jgi:hypothetical protein